MALFVFLSATFAASLLLCSEDSHAQVPQRVLKQKRVLPVLKTSVTSVAPQKAVLTQGGDPVIVEASGGNLGLINSAQVMRAGTAVVGFEVTLDKSQLTATLKVSLKALATAQIASDYQLAVFDAGNKKLLDVPNTVLAIEVQAPAQKAVLAQKTKVATTTQEREMTAARFSSPQLTSVNPATLTIKRGGQAGIIIIDTRNLTAAPAVQVLRQGQAAPEITAKILEFNSATGQAKVELQASANAVLNNDYLLRMVAGLKNVDIPGDIFKLEVIAPTISALKTTKAQTPQSAVSREKTFEFAKPGPKPDLVAINAVFNYGRLPITVSDGFDYKIEFKNQGQENALFDKGTNGLRSYANIAIPGTTFHSSFVVKDLPRYNENSIEAPAVIAPGDVWAGHTMFSAGTLGPGNYQLKVELDPSNSVAESDETNNTSLFAFEVIQGDLADLVITNMEIESPTQDYGDHTIKVYVKNQGKGRCLQNSLGITLNQDDAFWFPTDQLQFFETNITKIYTLKKYLNLQPGSYNWYVKVDSFERVPEENEMNNDANFKVDFSTDRTATVSRLLSFRKRISVPIEKKVIKK